MLDPLTIIDFLSDLCTRRASVQSGGDGKPVVCMACEMDQLFEEAFNGDHTPFTPHTFLYSYVLTWCRTCTNVRVNE
jgi:hypothetical protein